ncbi:MAG: hypothetical protein K9M98_05360 [Cephaloticoccus sp.]|nr:hypothetical protein [Cephaloticoccus sp.]MCF7759911.1 hypothetical protein [Cephaloticoccus sp.]
MPVDHLQLGPRLKFWTYGTLGLLFLSGVFWWTLQRWGMIESEFGLAAHPLAPWVLRLHGLAAMVFLVVLGILLPLHVSRSWRVAKNRFSGAGMLLFLFILGISGWLLYYAGGETFRTIVAMIHTWIGVALPLVIVVHILLGRRSRI